MGKSGIIIHITIILNKLNTNINNIIKENTIKTVADIHMLINNCHHLSSLLSSKNSGVSFKNVISLNSNTDKPKNNKGPETESCPGIIESINCFISSSSIDQASCSIGPHLASSQSKETLALFKLFKFSLKFHLNLSSEAKNCDGKDHTAEVMIVDKSTTAHIKNQLICISTPAIKAFFITFNGAHLSFHLPKVHTNIFCITAKSIINHKAKLAKFLMIFHRFQRLVSKCKKDQYKISLVISLPARFANMTHHQDKKETI